MLSLLLLRLIKISLRKHKSKVETALTREEDGGQQVDAKLSRLVYKQMA